MIEIKNSNVNYDGENLNEIVKNQITSISEKRVIGMLTNEQKAEYLMLLKARKSKDKLLDPTVRSEKGNSCNINVIVKNRTVYS
ncbi:MAG: hypothetical protein R3Y50_05595 [Rikenellaceae bacterium]